MRKHFILLLLTTALLTAYAQTPLNRLDSLYFDGDVEAASVYAEKVLNDPNQSASQKKAVSAYLEMRRFLTDTTLSGREKRTGLDACLPLAEEAATSDPVCADAWYARALNRMFAANMVREFSSLEAITAAKDDFIRAINADPNHFGSLAELSGIYGHMPELITSNNCTLSAEPNETLSNWSPCSCDAIGAYANGKKSCRLKRVLLLPLNHRLKRPPPLKARSKPKRFSEHRQMIGQKQPAFPRNFI